MYLIILLLLILGIYFGFIFYFKFLNKEIKIKYNIKSPFSKEMVQYLNFEIIKVSKNNKIDEEIYGKEKHNIYFKSKFKAFKSFKFAFIWHILVNIFVVISAIVLCFLLKLFWFDFFYSQDNFIWNFLSIIYFIAIFFLFLLLLYLIFSSTKEIFFLKLFKSIDYTEKGIYLVQVNMQGKIPGNGHLLSKKVFYNYSNIDIFKLNSDSIYIVIKKTGILNIKFYYKFRIYLPKKELEELNMVLKNNVHQN